MDGADDWSHLVYVHAVTGTGGIGPPKASAPIMGTDEKSQTRRRFRGRQPLCGIGVMSRIAPT